MKKKLMALTLALLMVFSFSGAVYAEEIIDEEIIDEEEDLIPAAPAIAGIILAAEETDPNQSTGKGKNKVTLNLISEVAQYMGTQTLFNGIEKSILDDEGIEVCNPAYWDAVLAFLNSYGFTFTYSLADYTAAQA